MNHFIDLENVAREFILEIINELCAIRSSDLSLENFYSENSKHFKTKIMATLFTSESLRTRAGFISSFIRLGGSNLYFTEIENQIRENSCNEPINDIAGFISQYCDVLVVRTDSLNIFEEILRGSRVPVISAGHSNVSHPTTALNYMAKIFEELGRLDNLNILSITSPDKRTIKSLKSGLKKFPNNNVDIINPLDINLKIKNIYKEYEKYDVLFFDESPSDYAKGEKTYLTLDLNNYKKLKSSTCIIHAKPVIQLFSEDLKKSLNHELLSQSKQSSLIKSLLLKKLVNV